METNSSVFRRRRVRQCATTLTSTCAFTLSWTKGGSKRICTRSCLNTTSIWKRIIWLRLRRKRGRSSPRRRDRGSQCKRRVTLGRGKRTEKTWAGKTTRTKRKEPTASETWLSPCWPDSNSTTHLRPSKSTAGTRRKQTTNASRLRRRRHLKTQQTKMNTKTPKLSPSRNRRQASQKRGPCSLTKNFTTWTTTLFATTN